MRGERKDWTTIVEGKTERVTALDVHSAQTGDFKGVVFVTSTLVGVTQTFLPGITTDDLLVDRDRAEVLRLAAKLREVAGTSPSGMGMDVASIYRKAVEHTLAERWGELIREIGARPEWPHVEEALELATRRQKENT